MNTSKRNSSIELLRIIFMVLILTIYVYAHGSELNYKWIYSLGCNINTAWNLSIFSIGILGVTGFMFISDRLATGSLAIYLITDYPDIRTKLDPLLLPYVLKGYGLLVIAGICLTILCVDQVRIISYKLIDSHLRRI